MLITQRKKTGLSTLWIKREKLQNIKKIQQKDIIFNKRNLKLKFLKVELALTGFEISNFENMLLASIKIIVPRIKIEKIKIYW